MLIVLCILVGAIIGCGCVLNYYYYAELVPAQTGWRIPRETTGGDRITFSVPSGAKPTDHAEARNKMVREAILTHIKALRKLGQTRVNTRDIAVSLSLPHSLVEQVVGGLEDKGVKVVK